MNQLKHIAFIMDGNRRWAIQQGMMKTEGHQYGLKNMKDILKYSKHQGISQISFWVLAKKNIEERSAFEKEVLFRLIDAKIQDFAQDCLKEHIRIEYI
jgi:undecaprenyl diphosphate synthase